RPCFECGTRIFGGTTKDSNSLPSGSNLRVVQARPRRRPQKVFLNVPYDEQYEPLLLAFVAGLCRFGLTPRATIEIPGSQRRLNRIIKLIDECSYSFHDLSRVTLDRTTPQTPRF